MSFIHGTIHRLRVLWRGEAYASDVQREMEFHRELQAQAGHASPRQFGNASYYREATRETSALRWLDRLRQDLTYTVRALRRTPAFTLAVVITLALGVGVNAAMFSIFDAMFLRTPAGVPAPRALRRLYHLAHSSDPREAPRAWPTVTYPAYRAIAAANPGVLLAAASGPDSATMEIDGARMHAGVTEVSGNYFDVLSMRAQIGRFFAGDETAIETPTFVAVISDALWHSRFNGDVGVLGRKIKIGQRAFTIVGVTPRHFRGLDLDAGDVWVPLNTHIGQFMGASGPWYTNMSSMVTVVARLSPRVDERAFLGRATNAYRGVHLQYMADDPRAEVLDGSIVSALGPAKPAAEVIVAKRVSWIALIVLVIACANVVNLLLLRASRRRRELAVRRALGVSHGRLLMQMTTESVTLALVGGAVATVVAQVAGTALRRLMLPGIHWSTPVVEWRTAMFILATSIVVGLAVGVFPALNGLRTNVIDALRAGNRDAAYHASRLRGFSLVVQTALCIVLLVGAGLFLRSLNNVETIPLGYDGNGLLFLQPSFPDGAFAHGEDLRRAMPALVDQLRRVRGVTNVSLSSNAPMEGITFQEVFVPGRDSLPRIGPFGTPAGNSIGPSFFAATGMSLVAGRGIGAGDREGAPLVVVINETMAHAVWPAESPLGKCLMFGKRDGPCVTVVGVARDAHARRIIEARSMMYYRPLQQQKSAPMTLEVRVSGNSAGEVRAAAERLIRELMPASDGVEVRALSDLMARELRPWRLGASLFTAFGILSLIVAGFGIYSVVAYGASQRTNEMGIRIALGARTRDILDLVLADGARTVGIGAAIGVAAALIGGKLVGAFLFGVTPRDPSVMIGATVLLIALAIIASLVPGLRAARVDPAGALRAE